MQLIKISTTKVNIHTDAIQLTGIKINDLLLLSDSDVSIVCIVTGITGHESFDVDDNLTESGDFDVTVERTNVIEAAIIGSVKDGLFSKSIDNYPTIDVKIEKIDGQLFNHMLVKSHDNAFRIGKYESYDETAYIDGNRFFQRHASIVGNTGSGKSYCVSSILQKMSGLNSSNVILFDLHGEYKGLSFVKSIKIGNDGLGFPLWFLSLRDIYSFFLKMKEDSATTQIAALRKAFYEARNSDKSENMPIAFDMDDLVLLLEKQNDEVVSTGEYYKSGDKSGMQKMIKGENNGKLAPTIAAFQDKAIDSRYRFMTEFRKQSYLYEFVGEIFSIENRNIKVLDLSDVPHDMVPVVVAAITKLVYQAQLQQDRENIAPINIICEEAHVYIPSSDFGLSASQRRLLDVFELIAKEGRKFGVSLTIVSQRPSELNRTIMAQVENYIVLKMANETDKQFIKSILPESSRSIIDMLSLFSTGDCFAIGDASSIIFKIHIDEPLEPPISNTIDVWTRWSQDRQIDVRSLVDRILA